MLKRFSGGIHPPENKHTEDRAIEVMPAPKRVYIPFSQHTGKPAQPLVKKDDIVKIGTKIGKADGLISASVHSSIAGKVIAIEDYFHPVLGKALCCVIESNNDDEWEEGIKEKHDFRDLDKKDLLQVINDTGIVGLGGAAFPTHVKLSPPPEKIIDTLIINGCECEPVLTADHRLMLEYPTGVTEGAKIFKKILGARRLIFGVEDNKRNAAKLFKEEGMEISLLRTKYPQGAEKQLIKAILNREVPRGGLPMDVGCVVQNVGTCYAAFQALQFRKPLVDRVLTVAGNGVKESKNVMVGIGTPAIDVINFCGGYTGEPKKIIFGGPMMGIAQYSENVPVIKGTSGILVWNIDREFEEKPCVRCSHCVDVCPMKLMPTEIYKSAGLRKFEEARRSGALDCIECGCCAFACPAKIPLVHYIKYAKNEIWRMNKK